VGKLRVRALLVAAALCGAAAASAEAADASAGAARGPYFPKTYYPSSVLWTGFYVGAHIGGIWSSATWTDPLSGLSDNPQPSSFIGGGQVGVNWQMDSWVLGVEATIGGLRLNDSVIDGLGFRHNIRANYVATTTGRLGYAFEQYLVYAKGGAAFTGERNDVSQPGSAFIASTGTLTQVGATVGGGVEYMFDTNWSGRIEYDFFSFSSRDLTLARPKDTSLPVNIGPINIPVHVDWTWHEFLVGLNYRF
jgi:outer membrane immunogenic protein